jgi:hypothetical protein
MSSSNAGAMQRPRVVLGAAVGSPLPGHFVSDVPRAKRQAEKR